MTEEMLERFFNKQCSAEEAGQVLAFLKRNPDVLENYLGQNEWDETEPSLMPDEFWQTNWTAVQTQTKNSSSTTWIKRTAAVAAMIAGAIAVNYLLAPSSSSTRQQLSKRVQALAFERKITVNNSNEKMEIILPDSSQVILSPGALINYNKPFAKERRDISLNGEARFKVMKNKEKPFTVYAGGLATTALGTEFTINTGDAAKHNFSVKLHTGRVRITATGSLVIHWKKDFYLTPGQQLKFDTLKMTAYVGLIRNDVAVLPKLRTPAEKKNSIHYQPARLSFVNTSLPEVMTKLSQYYHQQIGYESADLEKMNFTGTISSNDSLGVVLKVIAQMNNLELVRGYGTYEIRKFKEKD